jgi:hypothetical protein
MVKNVVENRKKVEEALKNKEVDVVFNTKWPFIGDFLRFLEKKGILNELKKIIGEQKRKMVSSNVFVLIYLIKLIVGISRIRGTSELLSDSGTMSLIGFDIDILQGGLCNRGDANQHGKELKKNQFSCNG